METLTSPEGRVRGLLVAVGLTVAGFLTAELMTIPAFLADPTLLESPAAASRGTLTAFFVLNFLGFFVAGAAYLAYTGRGWAYVDLRTPTLRDWGYAVGGFVAGFALLLTVSLLAQAAGVEPTGSQVVDYLGGDSTMVLIMIVVVFLFNAPAEEFLFRNVIQKRLYDAFSRMGAVLVTSVIFALVHLPLFTLTDEGTLAEPLAIGVSMSVIFVGSVVFGYVYVKTENLFVPTMAHALFNAFQFGLLYLALEFGPDDVDGVPAVVEAVGTALEVAATLL